MTCNLDALVDTGSPVSFVLHSVFKNFFGQTFTLKKTNIKNLQTINNSNINVIGSISTTVGLTLLPNLELKVNFQVLDNDSWPTQVILGRDFISNNKLKLLYDPSLQHESNKLQLLNEVASVEVIDTINDPVDKISNLETDFGNDANIQLQTVIREVQDTPVELVKDDYNVEVTLKDNSIYAFAPCRFAHSERLQLREITDDLIARKIIKPSNSPYCARALMVPKRDGRRRLCVDLRPLNERVVKQHFIFPVIEECLSRLGNNRIFTSLDLKDGFHLIKIHPDSTKYFSFATPDGQFEYVRLPFGYCEAPAEFQKRLNYILNPLIREDKVLVYMDDILIPSNTIDENLNVLKQTLLLLKQYEFQVNYSKCKFLKGSVEYLGYSISPEGITLSDRHVEAIRKYPYPSSAIELQRAIGFFNYFRKFVVDYATRTKPLTNLLRKNADFVFDEKCKNAFDDLKAALSSHPVLRLYDPTKETELHTDASSTALGAILMQWQSSNKFAPISYYSQRTNDAESRYHSFELEMLAVVKAIERYHIYLYGVKFKVVSDCNALTYALKKASINPRVNRWILRLQSYDFDVEHRSGQKMPHVDALSRIHVATVENISIEKELQYKQLADPQIREIAKRLE